MSDEHLKRARRVRDALRRVFASDDGKIIWDDLSKAHYMTSSTFSTDPLELARREGERNVVLRMWSIINSIEVEHGSEAE